MRTKNDILNDMIDEMPFELNERIKPYILEAMDIYAKEYHKEQTKRESITTKTNQTDSKALHIGDVSGISVIGNVDSSAIAQAIEVAKETERGLIIFTGTEKQLKEVLRVQELGITESFKPETIIRENISANPHARNNKRNWKKR